ncbi:MAG: spore coat protein CotJB [Tissierellia bacterium]|nr:spore coat protein CotJB [Tissierellia bacterium]
MDREQKILLKEIMEISFVLVETSLYLNTHPDDQRALNLHNTYSQKYSELITQYESRYGLITNTGISGYPWNYINEPWPWEINFDIS